MTDEKRRRLAAILMMDVVGYSRMMAEDEGLTFDLLKSIRLEVSAPIVARLRGRLVKDMGDGSLVEFSSVSDALQCALDIQGKMAERNGSSDEDQRIQFRIGLNLGEVIVEGEDIFGDGVNVAARVEGLADPGGIALTATAKEHLRSSFPVKFEDVGDVSIKNIPYPVRVYKVNQFAEIGRTAVTAGKTSRRLVSILAAFSAILAIVFLSLFGADQAAPVDTDNSVSAEENRPSVAVMPFQNLSGDDRQAYFSDGMTDNLITDLSRVGGLLVIARNTSFSFRERDEATDAQSVGDALGVRYVVEGSVQRAGDHVRINASLIDTNTGYQVWAGRLDKEFADLFALQDEVTQNIIDALHIELTRDERRQLSKKYTHSLEAYDLYLRAWEEIWRFNEEARVVAQNYLRKALEIDPDFALAKAIMATSYTNRNGVALEDNEAMLQRGYELANEAVALDPDLPAVQSALGLVLMFRRDYEGADAAFLKAIELDPNYADAIAMQSWNRHYSGDAEAALQGFERALELNPRAPFPYLNAMAEINFSLGNYEKSLELNEIAISRNAEALRQRIFMAAALVNLGRIDDAEWEVEEALALQPELSISSLHFIAPYKDPERLEDLSSALRKAGLPE